ncbi:Bestrophin, RFP-TM, chloride channel-domain-containing protein [Lophiotrema nucula]|uniref:Bestrophin, RFP-TM, chloride channel-domain-containing protein n=1 Tax=Lophiotrema nucula TaxID=690887 RepID=A0A6A5ZJ14_9PLEO|nr:Bestrophin, RFP-TM, chloride channel-domain-containing protein [Lophiotrema nucula]
MPCRSRPFLKTARDTPPATTMASSTEKVTPAATVTKNGTSTNGLAPPKLKRQDSDDTDLDDYFVGPRDMEHHSKWPIFLRLHGSITPEMVLPLLFVGGWSTCITCISKFVHDLGISQLLLTVLGFVVGLALSFRSSTAYERYGEGRKYWAQLTLASQNLARLIWIHAEEREGEDAKKDLLAKITAMNLIVGFSVALKHKLRFEPFTHYDDLKHLVGHLDTFAKSADLPDDNKKKSVWKTTGEFLGLSFAESNPRKNLKRTKKPLGNLPLEILNHLSAYIKTIFDNGTLKVSIYQTQALNGVTTLNDVLTGTDRILNTPLPIAYSIAIGQITWVYILLLPFQLFKSLGWVTIPASMFAAYIILGIALIGREIENPFGDDVNDLPLDEFCQQIRKDIDTIIARPPPKTDDFVTSSNNMLLHPLSHHTYGAWNSKTVEEIREALRAKPEQQFEREEHSDASTPKSPKPRPSHQSDAAAAAV